MSTRDDIATVLQYVMPMCSVFAFLFVVPILLKRIVHEKEGGVKVWKSKVEAGKKEMYKKTSFFPVPGVPQDDRSLQLLLLAFLVPVSFSLQPGDSDDDNHTTCGRFQGKAALKLNTYKSKLLTNSTKKYASN